MRLAVIVIVPVLGIVQAATLERNRQGSTFPPGVTETEFVFESAPFASAHASTIVETRQGRWNPVLFERRDKTLMLFYKVGPSPQSWWGMLRTSLDGGRTWTEARRLPDGILGPIKNKPVQLADGTLVAPSSAESPERSQRVFETWSDDGGRSWTPIALTTLPNPNSGVDAVTLSDGRHLIVYNHTTRGRSPLNVSVSRDGKLWDAALSLEREPGEYSYPAVIQSSDGQVHVTYTWKRQRIKHVVIDPTRLRPMPMLDGNWPQ